MKLNSISNQNVVNFNNNVNNIAFKSAKTESKPDSVELSSNIAPPKLNPLRIIFNYLNDEQVEQVNKSRKLPENAKFVMNGFGGHGISWNLFNITTGTQTLPEGFEVKRNFLGFAVVLPKDSEGLFIRK